MEKLAKHGPVVKRGRAPTAHYGIVFWTLSHQVAKPFTIGVTENLEEGNLGYRSQHRFHELELGCQCFVYQCLFYG